MLNFEVLFQNDDFIIAHKPNGINVHSEDSQPGFVVQLEQQLNQKLYLAHRLDKETSGLLMIAKSSVVANDFRKLFEDKKIEKIYIAIASNKPKKKQGWIKGDMIKSRRGTYKLMRTCENPAITFFESESLIPGFRKYTLYPKTGKTHQLRVALKSISAPILGDTKYSGDKADRLYLHANTLKFTYKKQVYEFTSPPHTGEFFKTLNITKHQAEK